METHDTNQSLVLFQGDPLTTKPPFVRYVFTCFVVLQFKSIIIDETFYTLSYYTSVNGLRSVSGTECLTYPLSSTRSLHFSPEDSSIGSHNIQQRFHLLNPDQTLPHAKTPSNQTTYLVPSTPPLNFFDPGYKIQRRVVFSLQRKRLRTWTRPEH